MQFTKNGWCDSWECSRSYFNVAARRDALNFECSRVVWRVGGVQFGFFHSSCSTRRIMQLGGGKHGHGNEPEAHFYVSFPLIQPPPDGWMDGGTRPTLRSPLSLNLRVQNPKKPLFCSQTLDARWTKVLLFNERKKE